MRCHHFAFKSRKVCEASFSDGLREGNGETARACRKRKKRYEGNIPSEEAFVIRWMYPGRFYPSEKVAELFKIKPGEGGNWTPSSPRRRRAYSFCPIKTRIKIRLSVPTKKGCDTGGRLKLICLFPDLPSESSIRFGPHKLSPTLAVVNETYLDGGLELLVFLLELFRVAQTSRDAKSGGQHALSALDPSDHLKDK